MTETEVTQLIAQLEILRFVLYLIITFVVYHWISGIVEDLKSN